jgi:hypothetical protein
VLTASQVCAALMLGGVAIVVAMQTFGATWELISTRKGKS